MSDLEREVTEALVLASGPATVRDLAEAFLDSQCRRAEAERQVQRLSVDCNALRLALRSGLPNCLGCGKEFHTFVDAYRCTHCDGYLHKRCAESHFGGLPEANFYRS